MGKVLAIDVGNTNIHWAVFDNEELKAKTETKNTVVRIPPCLPIEGVEGVVISSVVLNLEAEFRRLIKERLGTEPIFADYKNAGIKTRYQYPQELGADRVANVVAASICYPLPALVIDIGTAITFDAISADREHLGGVIFPGPSILIDSLWRKTSRLPKIKMAKPSSVVAVETKAGMQAGIYYGVVGAVEYTIERIKQESGLDFLVIATGGLASLMKEDIPSVKVLSPNLTLEGLRIIYQKINQG